MDTTENKETNPLKRLVEEAKNNPQFFHDLVFNPEKAIAKIDYLDRRIKGAIVATSPEGLIGSLVAGPGRTNWCDVTCTSSCGQTCTGKSCGYTTNIVADFGGRINPGIGAAGCDVTCTSSCGVTCNTSCGYTTNFTNDFREAIR